MARVVQPADICLDIGANVGVYTMILSELATQGEVHAFEPSAINSKFLTENITRNGLRNAVLIRSVWAERRENRNFTTLSNWQDARFLIRGTEIS